MTSQGRCGSVAKPCVRSVAFTRRTARKTVPVFMPLLTRSISLCIGEAWEHCDHQIRKIYFTLGACVSRMISIVEDLEAVQ